MVKNNTSNLESLHKYRERHFYKKDTVLYEENSYGKHFYLIKSGLIKIFTLTLKGNERILNIAYPGEFIGVLGINNNKNLTTAVAMEDSVLYRFEFEEIGELMSTHPAFLRIVTDTISRNTNTLLENLYLDSMNAKQRISYLILLYVNDFENDRIALTIADFTKYTGLTRVRVYQILKEWESEGLISIKQKHFHILNLEYFEQLIKNDR